MAPMFDFQLSLLFLQMFLQLSRSYHQKQASQSKKLSAITSVHHTGSLDKPGVTGNSERKMVRRKKVIDKTCQ